MHGNDDRGVVVVGTSNSIRTGGYVTYLSQQIPVHNVSIGASTSVHSIWSTEDLDFSRYSHCILDFAVNEEVVHRSGGTTLETIATIVESLICRAVAEKCLPIVLILPRVQNIPAAIRDFYVDLARKNGLPWLDGYFIAERLAAYGMPIPAVFLDGSHIHDWLSPIVGELLLRGIRRTRSARWRDESWSAARFLSTHIQPFLAGSVAVVERRTSLFNGQFVRVDGATELAVADLPGEEIFGFRTNLAMSATFLRIGDRTLDLRNKYYRSKRTVVISALPAPVPIPLDAGTLRLATIAQPAIGEAISSMAGELGHSEYPATGEFEISDVFLRSADKAVSAFRADSAMSLVGPEDEGMIRAAQGVYRVFRSEESDQQAALSYHAKMVQRRERRRELAQLRGA